MTDPLTFCTSCGVDLAHMTPAQVALHRTSGEYVIRTCKGGTNQTLTRKMYLHYVSEGASADRRGDIPTARIMYAKAGLAYPR